MARNGFVGQRVPRREDHRLLTGRGEFVDDLCLGAQAHMAIVRSPHAHARIVRIDIAEALGMPGVLAVLTANDLAQDEVGCLPLTFDLPSWQGSHSASGMRAPGYPALAFERARFVGDAVAAVVADNADQARDASERVHVAYESLAAVPDCDSGVAADAPQLWDEAPGNVGFEWELGSERDVARAFASAAKVVRARLVNNRVSAAPLETRAAIGAYEPEAGRYTLFTGSQKPNSLRRQLAKSVFRVSEPSVRVVIRDVGGGFGAKNPLYPEQVLVLWAAKRVGRPVKWVSSRTESFLSDVHGRDNVTVGSLALDEKGRFLALRVSTLADLGAHLSGGGASSPTNNVRSLTNAYRIPHAHVRVRGVFTNTTPTDVYRGAGRPEAIYVIERLVDLAAHELNLSCDEIRRRNLIEAQDLPYTTALGLTIDSGDFRTNQDRALELADWANFPFRRTEAAARGFLRGIGLATYVERCGAGPTETVNVRFTPNGRTIVLSGAMSNGQGHETAFAQYMADVLGVDIDTVEVRQGDTDLIENGNGTGGSWSIPLGTGALSSACDKVIAKGVAIAARRLEAMPSAIAFSDGLFRDQGSNRTMSMQEVIEASFDYGGDAVGASELDSGGEFAAANFTFPGGCHVAEVEVERDTGLVRILKYVISHDFGNVLNPSLLEGQVVGGVAQGIGQALFESCVYDAEGQPLTGSMMDYCLPRAGDMPEIAFDLQPTPCPSNPGGFKGCGESGAAGAPPAVMNALANALSECGVRHLDMPATPERVWKAIRDGESHSLRADVSRVRLRPPAASVWHPPAAIPAAARSSGDLVHIGGEVRDDLSATEGTRPATAL
jgi:carbon-monoxide dehydrogenase large subunit